MQAKSTIKPLDVMDHQYQNMGDPKVEFYSRVSALVLLILLMYMHSSFGFRV